jgi:hypothetical protein
MLFAGDVVSATSAREKGYKLVEKEDQGLPGQFVLDRIRLHFKA